MELSPLESAIPNFDAPTLQGFDEGSAVPGERIKGSNRQFVRFYEHTITDIQAIPEFTTINPKTGTATVKKTRAVPVKKLFVEIITPGDTNKVDGVATQWHINTFWRQYKSYRDGETGPIGIALSECAFIPPQLLTELRYRSIHTAEQLADAPDSICEILGENGFEIREMARTKVNAELSQKESPKVLLMQQELAETRKALAELKAQFTSKLVNSSGDPISSAPVQRKKRGPNKKKEIAEV